MTPRSLAVVGQDRLELGDGARAAPPSPLRARCGRAGSGGPASCRGCASACTSVNAKGSAISAVRAAGRSSEPRMVAMTASSMSMALRRPSTMWARSRALSQPELRAPGDDLDLVVDVVRRAPGPGSSVRGTPSTSASMFTPKLVCSGVCLKRLLSTTLALASRLSSMTRRGCWLAESLRSSLMPSRSPGPHQVGDLLLDHLDRGLVRAARSPRCGRRPRPSSISATARILIEPRPVR